jgi:hypothetical protein
MMHGFEETGQQCCSIAARELGKINAGLRFFGGKPPGNPIYSSPHRLLTFAEN